MKTNLGCRDLIAPCVRQETKITSIMETLLSFGFLAGLVLLMGEFDALTTSVIITKVIAVATMVICGALLPHYVTEEELND